MSMTTSTTKKSIFDGRKMWFIFGAIAAAVVAILTFTLMSSVTAKTSYYVLNKDIPARTQITPSLLSEVSVSAGSTPPNTLTLSDINTDTYSLYALHAGDTLTASNTGAQTALTAGLPKDYVVASFTANPSVAAGGNIKRGDYIDIMTTMNEPTVTGKEGFTASYALQHVLVIDATVNLDNADASSSDTAGGSSGSSSSTTSSSSTSTSSSTSDSSGTSAIPTMYTVGLSQEDATRLAVATNYDLFVVLSSQNEVNGKVSATPGSSSTADIWGDTAPDAGKGTDNTFGQGSVIKPGSSSSSNSGSSSSSNTSTPSSSATPEAPSTPSDSSTDSSTTGN